MFYGSESKEYSDRENYQFKNHGNVDPIVQNTDCTSRISANFHLVDKKLKAVGADKREENTAGYYPDCHTGKNGLGNLGPFEEYRTEGKSKCIANPRHYERVPQINAQLRAALKVKNIHAVKNGKIVSPYAYGNSSDRAVSLAIRNTVITTGITMAVISIMDNHFSNVDAGIISQSEP